MKLKILMFFIFIIMVGIYRQTSTGNTPFDYFTRLSSAFLHGRTYLNENPNWLNELIPQDGKYFVVYPPMPSIVALPFVFFWSDFQQQYLAHLLGAGLVVTTGFLSWHIKKSKKLLLWSSTLIGLGSIVWFMSSNGSSWYLGQITAAFFLMLAIYESLSHKRPLLVGVLLGAAYLSRLQLILSLPFFFVVFSDEKRIKNYMQIVAGLIPFLAVNALYNFTRFGVIWDKAYVLIPGVLEEPWYKEGIFSPSYIGRHVEIILSSLPKKIAEYPYIIPSWRGLAIWITTPAFIYAIFANFKEKLVWAAWFSILLISIVNFSHGTTGFAQFGYRFAVDFYPFLIFLTIKTVAKSGLKWHHWLLVLIGVLVNLWGVTFIKNGWVEF